MAGQLQTRMMAELGLTADDFAYHESDLYVIATNDVRNWLQGNYAHWDNVSAFHSPADSEWKGAGRLCFDIPFANS